MSLRDESKKTYRLNGMIPSENELKVGCLQRIADATEKMAARHTELMEDRDYYKGAYERGVERERRLERRVAALKGAITRIKKRKKG